MEEHPRGRSWLPAAQAAEDRYEAVAAALQPAKLRCTTARSPAAAGGAQQSARKAGRASIGAAGCQNDARSRADECAARSQRRSKLEGRGTALVLHPQRG